MKSQWRVCGLIILFSLWQATAFAATDTIKIAANLEISGEDKEAVSVTIQGIELAKEELNGKVKIGDNTYEIEILYLDNQRDKSEAVRLAVNSIQEDQVMAIILPRNSSIAIPVSQVSNAFFTPSIGTTCTSGKITKGHPYAFRTAISADGQTLGTMALATKEWQAKKAAVLYDELNGYSIEMAKNLRRMFTEKMGDGSVVAFETFRFKDKSYTEQLKRIVASGADFLYVPQQPFEVPDIVAQARALGWTKPITGSDTWGTPELLEECGQGDCQGMYFTSSFAAKNAKGRARDFVDHYQRKYNATPNESAALGYDAFMIIADALRKLPELTGNILTDRKRLREQIASIAYDGASGKISYDTDGEPTRCAAIVQIDQSGEFSHYMTTCP
ncbi:MAG: hypothetical protein CSA29_02925 [Desulfobacterales bacterium]|nr:MAG: hypothetical protein CSA29_02925 [Desulfobacterales bacterium]